MIESRDCPICGGEVMFIYVRPDFTFYINEGKIERDTNNDLWEGKDPYIRFRCVNDELHAIDIQEGRPIDSFSNWKEDVTKEFYEKGHDDV